MSRNRMRMSLFVLVVFALVVSGMSALLAGEITMDKTALEKLNDNSITAAVRGKLAADNIRNLSLNVFAHVEVQAERGSVTLNGVVPTAEGKARAEQLAREVNGIKEITNSLTVQPVERR